ncbi:MAG: hypothetical protein IJD18_01180, partial [Clostridia bacterium]|nr:hypothetical protein [Clostridia bacterium]
MTAVLAQLNAQLAQSKLNNTKPFSPMHNAWAFFCTKRLLGTFSTKFQKVRACTESFCPQWGCWGMWHLGYVKLKKGLWSNPSLKVRLWWAKTCKKCKTTLRTVGDAGPYKGNKLPVLQIPPNV